jgi:hypothetical protein
LIIKVPIGVIMALTEKKIVDLIEVTENGCLQIREAIIIEKDGVQIAKSLHRYVLSPGQDVSDKEQRIQDIAAAVWTTEVVAAYQATQQNNT